MDTYYEFETDLTTYKKVKSKIFRRLGAPVLLCFLVQGKKEIMITESEEEAKIASEITGQPIVKQQYEVTDNRQHNERSFTWGT